MLFNSGLKTFDVCIVKIIIFIECWFVNTSNKCNEGEVPEFNEFC